MDSTDESTEVPNGQDSAPITPDRITFTTITRTDIVRHTIGELDDDCEYVVYVDGVPAGRASSKSDLVAIYSRLLQGAEETATDQSEQTDGGEADIDTANANSSASGSAQADAKSASNSTSNSSADNAVIIIMPRESERDYDHEHPLCPYNLPGRLGLAGLVLGSCALTAVFCNTSRKADVPPKEDFAYVDSRR